MNFLERYFRRRAMQRDPLTEADLPPALKAVNVGAIVAINGFNFRVVHRRCGSRGRDPGIVLAPIGPTRKRLKERRQLLRRMLRFGRRAA